MTTDLKKFIKFLIKKSFRKETLALISFIFLASLSLNRIFQDKYVLGEVSENPNLVRVTRVVDGDTIELSDGKKLRYIGIDTPETVHPTVKDECFGEEAKFANEQLVENKNIELEFDVNQTDRYGRILAYVWLVDGESKQMVNEILVREGFAFASSYPPDVKYQEIFREAEREAREENRGLWESCELNDVEEINELIKEVQF